MSNQVEILHKVPLLRRFSPPENPHKKAETCKKWSKKCLFERLFSAKTRFLSETHVPKRAFSSYVKISEVAVNERFPRPCVRRPPPKSQLRRAVLSMGLLTSNYGFAVSKPIERTALRSWLSGGGCRVQSCGSCSFVVTSEILT